MSNVTPLTRPGRVNLSVETNDHCFIVRKRIGEAEEKIAFTPEECDYLIERLMEYRMPWEPVS